MRGQAGNLSDLTLASSQYDILLCSETLVSDMRHVSEFDQPVAEVLAYLHVQISPISCNVVGSILLVLG